MIIHSVRTNCGNRATIVLMVGIILVLCISPKSSRADQQPPMVTVGYQSGTITAIYEATFQIDHRTYSLTSDAVLLDRHGDELNASYMRVDIEVKYHLHKDSKDKIDRIILYLPH